MHSSKGIIYQISGVLILISAVLYLFVPIIAPWIMGVSVLVFSVVTALSPYSGKSIRGKRLFNFQIFSCILMIVATYLMFKNNNLWALLMMVGAVFLFYAGIMIPKELEKE
ncbi:MAG: hypothetical protein Q4G63_12560 [Bacteroidia bacterium]|nr:hypothetical protein [Bacteroidia bacterium]